MKERWTLGKEFENCAYMLAIIKSFIYVPALPTNINRKIDAFLLASVVGGVKVLD